MAPYPARLPAFGVAKWRDVQEVMADLDPHIGDSDRSGSIGDATGAGNRDIDHGRSEKFDDAAEQARLLRKAERLTIERTRRADWFPEVYIGDAAWNMLLTLYISHQTGRAETIKSVCVAALSSSTTALRWIHALRQAGFVRFSPVEADRRCVAVQLTARSLDAMQGYLRGISAEETS
jgi:DNA-binding MarR family transcriptional regulator